ncbi:MAG: transcriptional regulator, partial [Pseudolabrys sp.]
ALVRKRYVVLSDEGGELTVAGKRFLSGFGSVIMSASGSRRIFCRPCLDWSERRYHIAGHVGAEICRCCLERGWLVRQQGSRAIRLTTVGRRGLRQVFGIEPPDMR